MAQKIPFFELFTDFSPDFDLRVPLNAAMVTNMVLEPEKRISLIFALSYNLAR